MVLLIGLQRLLKNMLKIDNIIPVFLDENSDGPNEPRNIDISVAKFIIRCF